MRPEQIRLSVLFLFIQGGRGGGELSDWSLLGFARRRAPRWELLLYWGTIQTGGCKGIWIIGPAPAQGCDVKNMNLELTKVANQVNSSHAEWQTFVQAPALTLVSVFVGISTGDHHVLWSLLYFSFCPPDAGESLEWRGCLIELICLSATYLSAQSRALRLTNRLTSSPGCPERPTMARQGPHLT